MPPWGWTWVDAAPWGFAPAHYGRWFHDNDRWAWAPSNPGAPAGVAPAYAPALVRFFGLAAAAPSVGCRWDRASLVPFSRGGGPGYARAVNAGSVPNGGAAPGRADTFITLVNHNAAVFVAPSVLTGSRPVVAPGPAMAPRFFGRRGPIGFHAAGTAAPAPAPRWDGRPLKRLPAPPT